MIDTRILAAAALVGLALSTSGVTKADERPGFDPVPFRAAYLGPEISRYRVRGRVDDFNRFSMTVRAGGRELPMNLHRGTIILPTGLTLQPGMFVSVEGSWDEGVFRADRIVLVR